MTPPSLKRTKVPSWAMFLFAILWISPCLAFGVEPPGTNDSLQSGWTRTVAKIAGLKVLNSGTTTGNPAGTWYWTYAYATSLPSPNTASGSTDFDQSDFVGNRVRSPDHLTAATSNPSEILVGGFVNNLRADTTYDLYAQACVPNNYNTVNCSSWVKLRSTSITTLPLPSNVFNTILLGDVTSNSLRVDTTVPDPTDVKNARVTIRNVDAGGIDTVLYPIAYSDPFIIDSNLYPFTPNADLEMRDAQAEYPYGQFTAKEQKGHFVTTPADPGPGSITTVTHFTVSGSFQDAAGSVGNPTNTTYKVTIYKASDNSVVKSVSVQTPSSLPSQTMSFSVTGLAPNNAYNVKVKAIGKAAADSSKWNDSNEILIGSFSTLPFTLSITINPATVTSTSGVARLTVNSAAGIDHFVLSAGPITYPATVFTGGAGGDPNSQDFTMTGLTPNTDYADTAIMCESTNNSQCSDPLPVPAPHFTTTPVAPTGGSLTASSPRALTANFTDPSTNPTGSLYELQICQDGAFTIGCQTATQAKVAGTNQSMSVTSGINPETLYFGRVRTRNVSRPTWPDSSYTGLGSVVTPNEAPTVPPPSCTVNATSANCSVNATDNGGPAPLNYHWSASPGAGVTINPNDQLNNNATTLSFPSNGGYTVTVTVTDQYGRGLSNTNSVNIIVGQIPKSIAISPTSARIVTGLTKTFAATVVDQFGTIISNAAVNWSATGGGTVSPPSGVSTAFTATTPGTFTLTAGLPGAAPGTAAVTVLAAGPFFVNSPALVLNPDGKTGNARALAGDNVSGEIGITYGWKSKSGPAEVRFSPNNSNSAKNTVVTFTKSGTYVLECTAANPNGSATAPTSPVTLNAILTSLTVTPDGVDVKVLYPQDFTANGFDQFGSAMGVVTNVTWAATSGVISGAGVFRSDTLGRRIRITATSGKVNASAFVNVINYDLSNAFAFPVPYKSTQGGGITFKNLGTSSTIRIYTITGRQIVDLHSDQDAFAWDLKNFNGENVASGVYFYIIESPEAKKEGKLVVIQ